MARKMFGFVGMLVAVLAVALVFGFAVSADEPNGPATIGWTGVPKHVAGEPWKQSGVLFDKGGLKVAQDTQLVATVGTEVITVTAKAGEFGIQTTKVYTQTGEFPIRVVYSGTVIFNGKTTISPAAVASIEVIPHFSDYEWVAGEELSFGVSATDRFGNAIGVPAGQAIWYRIDLPADKPITVSRTYTQSLPAVTDVVSTTKVGLLGISACVDGKCASFQHAVGAANVVSLTVNAPMTVTTGSKFEVVSKGVDQYGNTSSKSVKYGWMSPDSNGDLVGMLGSSISVNAGSVTGTMAIQATIGKIVATANVAVIEAKSVVTSGASATSEWKANTVEQIKARGAKTGATLKIESGDTYYNIGLAAGVSWEQIAKGDATPGLQVGETITIPAGM